MFLRPLFARSLPPLAPAWPAVRAVWPPSSSGFDAHPGACPPRGWPCPSLWIWRGFVSSPADCGQPSPETHPELLAPGEVTPGISAAEYAARRSALLALLPPRSVALLPAAPPVYMAGVIPYPYRQDADFAYLTGCLQPGGVAVLEKRGGADGARFAMFMPPRDVVRERWDGPLADSSAALSLFGADEAPRLEQLGGHVATLLSAGVQLFYDGRAADPGLHRVLPALGRALEQGLVRPLRPLVHRLRWKKSSAEIERMRAVSAVTAAAFKEGMRVSLESRHEHAVAAAFEYECKRRGAQRMAYPPVVGAGRNGCCIHYSRHDKQ
ncbi:Putative Xaa-Pro aminopeptidase [Klebsormidium nitens]|uniref:Putative Xaa-Pro aminopeptidase n=1 Tax=Klebsormidium nitens TaxID=105231 RepID=A0A1Y1ISJ1_KLENI|nr:Putative Xaa-Pro aminopeptidase [Klebsormidium nitens]|eukprot:GAQ92241.1 Putative Xaa-Pro aminopeptidase [Klebsormidium nitens]